MPGREPKRSYWDSSVFLAWINGEEERTDVVDALLQSARKGEITVVTSVLTITEVAYATAESQSGTPSAGVLHRIDALWDPPSPVTLAEFHRLIAVDARNMMRLALPGGKRLKPPDAIHMSTAVRSRCEEILTYDPKWAAYAGELGVKIAEPSSTALPLPFDKTATPRPS